MGDLVNTRAGRSQQVDGMLDAKILKEGERRFAQNRLQSARQGPFARDGCASRFTEREAVGQLASGPSFKAFDKRI
jgi:hypothetical protein